MTVKKPDGSWQMTMGYWTLNKVAFPIHVAVPNIAAILDTLATVLGMYRALLDLANAFFTSHKINVFTWKGQQWTFEVLPQGYLHSPTVRHGTVAQDLSLFSFPMSTRW